MTTEAQITVKDNEKRQAIVVVWGCKSKDAALDIAEFLDTKSDAAVIEWAYIERETFSGNGGDGKYSSVDQQNILLFLDDEGRSLRFGIFAPKESTLNSEQQATPEIAGEVLELLQNCIEDLTLYYTGGGLTAQADLP